MQTATIDNILRFGPYEFVRELARSPLAERWLVLHERDHSSHVIYRFPVRHDKHSQRRFLAAVESLSAATHPHLLEIEQYSICSAGRGIIVTPFTGNHDGLLTLETLVDLKGGRMSPHETDRAITHLLEAVGSAHTAPGVGPCHGPVGIDQILVDRHGRAVIELYGLQRKLRWHDGPTPDAARDEIRSIGALAYRLLTGVMSDVALVPADRLVKGLSHLWVAWLERAMDPAGGFETAAEAIEVLPSNARDTSEEVRLGAVRTVLSRFRWTARSR